VCVINQQTIHLCFSDKKVAELNSLLSSYVAHLTQRNIYDKIANFQKDENTSNSFAILTTGLEESVIMRNGEGAEEATVEVTINMGKKKLTITVEVKDKWCAITKMKRY